MKRIAFIVLLCIGAAMPVLSQQPVPPKSSAPIDRPQEPNLVFDDDGGKTQIVPADLSVVVEKKFHGGEVMKSAQQISIFLGSAWADTQVRPREVALNDLAARQAAVVAELKTNNVRALSPAPLAEDFTDLKGTPVNDLTIQRKLADWIASKAVTGPTSSSVYVIYLAPGVNSTLGAHKAGIDYAAYHNYVHLDSGEVRYVVVPFDDREDRHAAAAARAFAETVLNPNGNGWY